MYDQLNVMCQNLYGSSADQNLYGNPDYPRLDDTKGKNLIGQKNYIYLSCTSP